MMQLIFLKNMLTKKVIKVGDIVKDINPQWPYFNHTGTVVFVKGLKITWKNNFNGRLITDNFKELQVIDKI